MIPRIEWCNATSIADVFARLDDGALVKAGGIDLMDRLKEGLDAPRRLVNIREIPSLRHVTETPEGGIVIGPLVTLAALAENPSVRSRFTALAEAAAGAATPQIRNAATLGGNLLQRPRCWYFRSSDFLCLKKGGRHCYAQDGENDYHAIMGNGTCAMVHPSATACALVALGASLEITGAESKRTVRLEEFFVAPEVDVRRENDLGDAELITAVHLPPPEGATSAYAKVGQKESFDWPLAEAAVVVTTSGGLVSRAAVVIGAAAPVPLRAGGAERRIEGRPLDERNAAAAGAAAVAGATPLAMNAYKLPLFETVVRRALLTAAGRRG